MINKILTGLTVDAFKGITPAVILAQIRRIGVEFAEVTVKVFAEPEKVMHSAGGMKLGLHLPIISENGFDFSCVEHQREIDEIIDNINKYQRPLNLQYILSHPTEAHLFETKCRISGDFLFENLKKIQAPVILENTFENAHFNFDTFLVKAEEKLGNHLTGICFDGPHAYISRGDLFPMLEKHFNKIRLVHLSDCTREKDLHIPFMGEGDLPIEKILHFLKDHAYSGIINLELRPKSLTDLKPIFNSYLLILKHLDRRKYFPMRLKQFFLLPLVHLRFR
ncbi:MAG TPA: sugar phosphate isomerase/epimerase [Bacteroidetes bacterium]|nr:sugar phosphate isomerase/epimerase [Bacteroidota bacterium]